MKNITSIICLLISSVVAYFIAQYTVSTITPLSLAIAVLVGGIVVLITTQSHPQTESSLDDLSHDDDETVISNGPTQTLYVGNLPYRANESAVRELFAEFGDVVSVRLLKDKQTGKRRGFGFVEMSASDADNAITALNEQEYQQRTLKVRVANERKEA